MPEFQSVQTTFANASATPPGKLAQELEWHNIENLTDNEVYGFKNAWNAVKNFEDLFSLKQSDVDDIGAAAVPAVVRAIKAHLNKRTSFPSAHKLQIKMCEYYFPGEGTYSVQGCLQFLDTVREISKTVRVHSLHLSRYTLDIL